MLSLSCTPQIFFLKPETRICCLPFLFLLLKISNAIAKDAKYSDFLTMFLGRLEGKRKKNQLNLTHQSKAYYLIPFQTITVQSILDSVLWHLPVSTFWFQKYQTISPAFGSFRCSGPQLRTGCGRQSHFHTCFCVAQEASAESTLRGSREL